MAHDGKSIFSAFELEQHTEALLEGVNFVRICQESERISLQLINFELDARFTIKDLVEHPYFHGEDG